MTSVYLPATPKHHVRIDLRVAVLIILAAALAALGAGLFAGCGSDEAQNDSQGVASDEVRTIVRDFLTAINQNDREAIWALFSENAMVDDFLIASPPARTEGRARVVDMIASFAGEGNDKGLGFTAAGEPIQLGDYVIQAVIFTGDGNPIGEGVHILEIDGDGKILHNWASGVFNDD